MHSKLRISSFTEKSGNPAVPSHRDELILSSDSFFVVFNHRLDLLCHAKKLTPSIVQEVCVSYSESSHANTALMTHVSLEFSYDIFDVVVPNRF